MDLGNGLGHLTYSTLVHPGDDWEQMWQSLITYVPKVKARIAGNRRFGVSLRLSANLAQTLAGSAAEREKLKKFLGDNNMYLYTVNAFPSALSREGASVRAGLALGRARPLHHQ